MTQSEQSQWNMGRFIQTLSYFGAIPLINNLDWVQQLLGSRANPTADRSALAIAPPTVLVIDPDPDFHTHLTEQLQPSGYAVRSLQSSEINDPQFSEQLASVQAIVCWVGDRAPDWLPTLIHAAAHSTHCRHIPIFDFSQSPQSVQETWGALDDVVMGGVSESDLRLEGDCAVFSGNVSTANSGGFASVRTRNFEPVLDLSDYEGVELRVRGDGKRYKFFIRCEDRWDGVGYAHSFDTAADGWITVQIPFDQLIPVFRAKTVDRAEPVNASRITSFQLMLSKFEYDRELNPHFSPGAFRLEVASIHAYGMAPKPRFVLLGDSEAIAPMEPLLQQHNLPYIVIPGTIPTAPQNTTDPVTLAAHGTMKLDSVAKACAQAIAQF